MKKLRSTFYFCRLASTRFAMIAARWDPAPELMSNPSTHSFVVPAPFTPILTTNVNYKPERCRYEQNANRIIKICTRRCDVWTVCRNRALMKFVCEILFIGLPCTTTSWPPTSSFPLSHSLFFFWFLMHLPCLDLLDFGCLFSLPLHGNNLMFPKNVSTRQFVYPILSLKPLCFSNNGLKFCIIQKMVTRNCVANNKIHRSMERVNLRLQK